MVVRKQKYNFVPYERPYDQAPYIHLSITSGIIFFSSKFIALHKLDELKYAQLFMDEARQVIAFRFHVKKSGHCYTIKKEHRTLNLNGQINAKPFIRELVKKGWLNDSFKSWYFTPQSYCRGKAVYYIIELPQGRQQP